MPLVNLGYDQQEGRNITTNDLKGKLVILDFWNIWCSSCISSMPKMEALQREFGDKIKVVLVTANSFKQGQALFTRIKKCPPSLPMIYSDTLLSRLFPHVAVPLHVWIGPDLRVEHITEAHNTSEKNIALTLEGKHLPFSIRKEISDLDLSAGLVKEVSRLSPYLYAYSLLLKGLPSITSSGQVQVEKDSITKKVTRIQAVNASVLQLFTTAYSKDLFDFELLLTHVKNNRTILEDSLARDLVFPRDASLVDEWTNRNLFGYEIVLPVDQEGDIYKSMQQDLNRYFRVEGHIEKRVVKGLALVKTTPPSSLIPVNCKGSPMARFSGNRLTVRNMPVKNSLLLQLVRANYTVDRPIVDETHYTEPVDMDIECSLNDFPCLRKELKRYGLDLVEKDVLLDVLVIRAKQ
jgi:thiol-disulfide isomerase/thioredoxin